MGIMSLFTGVKKALATVEVGARIAEKTTDGIISGLDSLVYTGEEKAEANQKAAETILGAWDRFSNENSEQSKARRWLAKLTFSVFFALIFILIGLWRIDIAWCVESIKIIREITGNPLMLMVAGAYFIPHQLSKIGILGGKK